MSQVEEEEAKVKGLRKDYELMLQELDEEGKEILGEFTGLHKETKSLEQKESKLGDLLSSNRKQKQNLMRILDSLNTALHLGYQEEDFAQISSNVKCSMLAKADKTMSDLNFMKRHLLRSDSGGAEKHSSSNIDTQLSHGNKHFRGSEDEDFVHEISRINGSLHRWREGDRDKSRLITEHLDTIKKEINQVACR